MLNYTANIKLPKVILDMSTTKRIVEIKSYSIGELSQLYEQSVKTMNRWLKPHGDTIGKRHGRYYTVKQIEKIFEALGLPKDYDEAI